MICVFLMVLHIMHLPRLFFLSFRCNLLRYRVATPCSSGISFSRKSIANSVVRRAGVSSKAVPNDWEALSGVTTPVGREFEPGGRNISSGFETLGTKAKEGLLEWCESSYITEASYDTT